jgi:hypothetical protein
MELESFFIYILVAVTSAAMVAFGVLRLGLRMDMLRKVLREVSECIGAFVVFFAINTILGIIAVFTFRGYVGFLSLYVVTDLMLVLLSAIQGFIFQLWWRRSRL